MSTTTQTTPTPEPFDDFWGEPIDIYTRAQALEDGVLVDISELAREYGITYPVAITRAAWEDTCDWTPADDARKHTGTGQSPAGRIWDVLTMFKHAARHGGTEILFQVLRIPREGTGTRPKLATLKALCGPGDNAEPVITIMHPDED